VVGVGQGQALGDLLPRMIEPKPRPLSSETSALLQTAHARAPDPAVRGAILQLGQSPGFALLPEQRQQQILRLVQLRGPLYGGEARNGAGALVRDPSFLFGTAEHQRDKIEEQLGGPQG
jgi:hypothetical protein